MRRGGWNEKKKIMRGWMDRKKMKKRPVLHKIVDPLTNGLQAHRLHEAAHGAWRKREGRENATAKW
jgi:hypothetical protein